MTEVDIKSGPLQVYDETAVITAGYYDRKGGDTRGKLLNYSAINNRCNFFVYGTNEIYPGTVMAKIYNLIPELLKLKAMGYKYAVFLDMEDTIVLDQFLPWRLWHNVGLRAQMYGHWCPDVLVSCEPNCFPDKSLEHHPSFFHYEDGYTFEGGWAYVNSGQFWGRIDSLVAVLKKMIELYGNSNLDCNDQAWWNQAWADGVLEPMGVRMDLTNELFLNMDGKPEDFDPRTTRAWAVHFSGGYVDPIKGREERMMPLWRKLGMDLYND